MLSGQELPGQCTHDNEGVNSVDKATDANNDPRKKRIIQLVQRI